MSQVAYATEAQMIAWVGPDGDADLVDDRLLCRASEVIDHYVRQPFAVIDDVGDDNYQRPDDDDLRTVFADACCAQVEYWGVTGETHDIEGLAGKTVSIMSYSGPLPVELAPRAARILATAGMLTVPNGTLGRAWS